ncbi:glutamate-5-semialdehyde dehydrogenase [Thermoactinomyces intermedius]|uniref:Gamma-glutamyl phosphate reductase n=2 Tax=Thermoactinomycetaceae TaxID=186824 RepID=A0A8I1A3W5_THEIN|nr:glutamate-5-semialdehyde dehydrogenase [Thermoactinomyces intermedius]MBH8601212.1 glutamate-5-semialdehyde dehydrogenase [Thermoactinomyces sp. CICC 23799]
MVKKKTRKAKQASRQLTMVSAREKNEALMRMGEKLWQMRDRIFEANQKDLEAAIQNGLSKAKQDRLLLNEKRLADMIEGLKVLAQSQDPVGEVMETHLRPNGLQVDKVRVPFGVIAIIYESRPNVTVDAAGLALKAGNAIVLRGGKEAIFSNQALVRVMCEGLAETKIPVDSIQLIDRTGRDTIDYLIRDKESVDLVIPRGGAGLIQRVVQNAHVPVIETGVGNCHIYVHASADFMMARSVVVNAKTQRPSVCNAMETLLVDQSIAEEFLPFLARELADRGVQVKGCEQTCRILQDEPSLKIEPAAEEDYDTEFLDLILAVKVVQGTGEALRHIERFGTGHSEAIIAEDQKAADAFLTQVDAAAVYHNASTRFTDGAEFGFGAEMGISTQKLHARGPMGLKELTSYKYVIRGTGQIRE